MRGRGNGEGQLLRMLMDEPAFDEIVGMGVSHRALEIAADRLKLDRLPPRRRERIRLMHGSLMYRDRCLEGYDAAAMVEVIEHMDPPRLAAFERVLWQHARQATIVLTTPNAEYNVRWPSLPAGDFATATTASSGRAQFQAWAGGVAERFEYTVRYVPVGPEDAEGGSPTQMAIFTRVDTGGNVERS